MIPPPTPTPPSLLPHSLLLTSSFWVAALTVFMERAVAEGLDVEGK